MEQGVENKGRERILYLSKKRILRNLHNGYEWIGLLFRRAMPLDSNCGEKAPVI